MYMTQNLTVQGHTAATCTESRAIDFSAIATKTSDDAWKAMKQADTERDLDDLREVR